MFSKPTEPRSIASQLVLRFTPAAAFLLFCALGVLYWIVVRHAFEVAFDRLDGAKQPYVALHEQFGFPRAGRRLDDERARDVQRSLALF